ncbi:MAG TPA: GNAT family N-acetyltransferase, partial [Candidatus Methylomirabilis sp.]|nr:GNAT family N-acetyltransferase [Candidatus Methylomirabilis sp.]
KLYQIYNQDVVGLDYAVMVDHWNRGLATEMAQASLAMGFERLSFPEVSCWALPINYASLRVMEKVGFRYEEDLGFAGLPYRFYRLTAAEWIRRRCRLAD